MIRADRRRLRRGALLNLGAIAPWALALGAFAFIAFAIAQVLP